MCRVPTPAEIAETERMLHDWVAWRAERGQGPAVQEQEQSVQLLLALIGPMPTSARRQ